MAIARVSGSHAEQQFAQSASARTLQYGGNLTSGSLLVCTVTTFTANITVTVSDGTNGSYTDSPQGFVPDGVIGSNIISQWYFPNNSSSAQPTVTVTPSASAFVSISLDEYTGVATSSPLRSSISNTSGGTPSSTVTTGTVTATVGDLVAASAGQGSSGATANSVNSPFTLVTNLGGATDEGLYTAYDLSAAGNEGCTFNLSGNVTWVAIAVSYKPAAAAAASLFRTPPLSGLGIGGSFFRDPLQGRRASR